MPDLNTIINSVSVPDSYGSALESEMCAIKDCIASNLSTFCENAAIYTAEAAGICILVGAVVYTAKKIYGNKN